MALRMKDLEFFSQTIIPICGDMSRDFGRHFEVEAVADGEAALISAKANPPALVLSDVMMPRIDGFGLVKAICADASLRETPIVLLSARAGEEAKIDGLGTGADDYLVKPFSARELVARVTTNLKMSRVRIATEQALRKRTVELQTVLQWSPPQSGSPMIQTLNTCLAIGRQPICYAWIETPMPL